MGSEFAYKVILSTGPMAKIRTMADIEAFERVPLPERQLPTSTYEALRRGAAKNPGKTALYFFSRGEDYEHPVEITFEQLMGRIRQTANLLHSVGVGPGDVVSVILPNLPQTQFALWGGEAAGIANPINPLLEPETICDIMNAAGTKVLVTLGPMPGFEIWSKVSKILNQVPTLKTVLQVVGRGDTQENIIPYDEVIDQFDATQLLSGRQIEPEDPAAVFHTGGTTGTPKLAIHTHGSEVFTAWIISEFIDLMESDVVLLGTPLFHVHGAILCSLMPYSVGVSTVLCGARGYRDPMVVGNLWRILQRYRVSVLAGVPTLYAALLELPLGEGNQSSVRFAISGAAPMPVGVFRAFEKKTGILILEGYGLTEGTAVGSVNPPYGERRVGSIGLRVPYQEMKSVRLDAAGNYERDCDPGEIGVIAIRGPNVFAGYKQQQHNRGLWTDDGSGRPWLNTGDMGRQDREGYFWLTGRIKELIIRGGHNIDPAAIEGPLYEHPAVALAAAIGRPDSYAGEVPIAYVTLKVGAKASTEELLAFVREKVGERAAVPKAIKIIEQMPLTAVGKVFKPQMRWWAIEDAYREALTDLASLAEILAVSAGPDETQGTLVRIRLKVGADSEPTEIKAKVAEILGRYTTRYLLEIVPD